MILTKMLPNEVREDTSVSHHRTRFSDARKKNQKETIETKASKQDDDKLWFFQRHELVYWKVMMQTSVTLATIYSVHNYPFFSHYKTTLWGK